MNFAWHLTAVTGCST